MERMTYTKNQNGEISFKTLTPGGGKRGDDHNVSALLAGIIAYYVKTTDQLFGKKKPVLMSAFRWVRGI
jgi:hypothetical protein